MWIAHSTGSGFASAQFVIADFGYNQGWRVDRHPRFVADVNGDGYQDIVGYGEDSVYRALGGPGYFGPMQGVLRALVATAIPLSTRYSPNDIVRTDLFQRMVGDVTGDGLQDLVATNDGYLIAAPSSPLPPPPPPDPPTNPRVTASTTSSLSIAWTAPLPNQKDTRQFFITYYKSGDTSTQTVATSASYRTYDLKALAADTSYCFSVQAESMWGVSFSSPTACGRTNAQTVNKGPFTITIWMARQQIIQGPPPYVGSFGPISQGANISVINFPTQYPAVLLVKPGHSTDECFTNPDAVVQVWGDMTAAQKQAIWGTANLAISGNQQLNFVGCTLAPYPQLPDLLPVNITFTNP